MTNIFINRPDTTHKSIWPHEICASCIKTSLTTSRMEWMFNYTTAQKNYNNTLGVGYRTTSDDIQGFTYVKSAY